MIETNQLKNEAPGRVERGFAVCSIMMLTNGPLLLLLCGGTSEGDGRVVPQSFPLIQASLLLVFVGTLYFLRRRFGPVLRMLLTQKYLLSLLALAVLSTIWSNAAGITFRRSLALIGTSLFGLYLCTRYSLRQQLELLATALGLAAFSSLLFVWLWPEYGVLAGPLHEGAWRGIYGHKNTLGQAMTLGTLVLLTLFTSRSRSRSMVALGLALSLLLVVFSTSKSAILMCAVLFMLFALFEAKQSPRVALFMSLIGVLLLTLLRVQVVSGLVARDLLRLHGDERNQPSRMVQRLTMTGRRDLWRELIPRIRSRPLLGYGFQSYWPTQGGTTQALWEKVVPTHAHNGFLDLLLDLGGLGLILFLACFVPAFRQSLMRAWRSRKPIDCWPLFFLCFFITINLPESQLLKHNRLLFPLFVAIVFSAKEESHRFHSLR